MTYSNKLVSIILPTKNSGKTIKKAIKGIKSQTYSDIECINIDNFSEDNTVDLLRDTAITYQKGPERSVQKNYGASLAKGEYLLFLDSDAEMEADVVKESVNLAEEKDLDCIIIPEIQVGYGFWSKVKALEREFYIGDDDIEAPWFFRKSSFDKVKGYNPELYAGEDWDLFERMKSIGCRWDRIDSKIHHHIGKVYFWGLSKKKFYYGKNFHHFIKNNPSMATLRRIPFLRKAFIKKIHLIIRHPVLFLCIFIMKGMESSFFLAGFLLSKFSAKRP